LGHIGADPIHPILSTTLQSAKKKAISTGMIGTFIITDTQLFCVKNKDLTTETELKPKTAGGDLTGGYSAIAAGDRNVHFLNATSKHIYRLKSPRSRVIIFFLNL